MTEQEWLVSADPAAMLLCIQGLELALDMPHKYYHMRKSLASDRKLRLFDESKWFNGLWRTDRDQADLLRDIFGNPFRPQYAWDNGRLWEPKRYEKTPSNYSAVWPEVRWLTPDVLGLARAAYEECDQSIWPVLADCLEESGCKDAVILNHCRGLDPCPQCGGTLEVTCKPKPELMAECSCTMPGTTDTPGWFPMKGKHVRGCWAIDCFLGKE